MVLVIFACINPCVKKRIITGIIKAFLAKNDPMRIGFFAFFSVITRRIKAISDKANTTRNGVEVQPKFCPKDGTQSKRLKKAITKKAPLRSKLFKGFLIKLCFGNVKKHSNKNMIQIIEETHISVFHPADSSIIPPIVGPNITAALEINI